MAPPRKFGMSGGLPKNLNSRQARCHGQGVQSLYPRGANRMDHEATRKMGRLWNLTILVAM
eukprot:674890-Amphidinium_carterae.1